MESEKYEILITLTSVDIITEEIYQELVDKYDKKTVDFLIEMEMEESDDLEKYKYYLDSKLEECNDNLNSSYHIYINDVRQCEAFDSEENSKYLSVLCNITKEIEVILGDANEENLSMLDRINQFLVCNNDNWEVLIKLKKLTSEYIDIRNKIVLGNLRLVTAIVRMYSFKNVDLMELIQWGNEGLMNAVSLYDISRGTSFSTYASFWIKKSIVQCLKSNKSLFKIPAYVYTFNNTRIRVIDELLKELKREPTDLEVAERMDISLLRLKSIKLAFDETIPFMDLYEAIDEDESLIDYSLDVSELYLEKETKIEIMKIIKTCLTEIEQLIIYKRFGLNGYHITTFDELGKELGMSCSNVAAIQKRVLKKIRKQCFDLSICW